MKLVCAIAVSFLFNLSLAANCDQAAVKRCLDTAYAGLDENLSRYGFDPNMADIQAPRVTCKHNSPNLRYNWGYIVIAGMVDFEGVSIVDPRQGECKHVGTDLRWLGGNF